MSLPLLLVATATATWTPAVCQAYREQAIDALSEVQVCVRELTKTRDDLRRADFVLELLDNTPAPPPHTCPSNTWAWPAVGAGLGAAAGVGVGLLVDTSDPMLLATGALGAVLGAVVAGALE